MSDSHNRIIDLLVQWEEGNAVGHPPSPESLCPDDVELQQLLRRRIDKRRKLLNAIIPSTTIDLAQRSLSASSPPDLPGYQLDDVIGAGGMGIVYKARQKGLNRPVAIKMVLAGIGSSLTDSTRFRIEAQAVAALQHPNIVQIYEVNEHEGKPFLALEYADGGNLSQTIKGSLIAPNKAARMVRDLALAIHHAHQHGVVHRDLKPANILLTIDGTLKISDFGLAKKLNSDSDQTRTGSIVGTPNYMSPEQATGRNRDIGPATDIYSLGVILYEMLTGRVPFVGETVLETLEQVRTLDPIPPRQLVPKSPKDLETICLKCLAKRTHDRYLSAQALAEDLSAFLNGDAIQARPDSPFKQIMRAVGRVDQSLIHLQQWGRVFFALSPIPALVHIVVVATCRHRTYFPSLIVGTTVTTLVVGLILAQLLEHKGLQLIIPRLRQLFRVQWTTLWIAAALIAFVIWWNCPPNHSELLLLFYPLLAIRVSALFFALAGDAGVLYVPGTLVFLLSIPMALWLPWAPVMVGLAMSCNLFGLGIFFRGLAKRWDSP